MMPSGISHVHGYGHDGVTVATSDYLRPLKGRMSIPAVDEKQLSPRSPTSLNATSSWSSYSTPRSMEIITNVIRNIEPDTGWPAGAAVSILALLVAGFRHHTCEVTFALWRRPPGG